MKISSLSRIFALTLASSLLAACGSGADSTQDLGSQSPNPPVSLPDPAWPDFRFVVRMAPVPVVAETAAKHADPAFRLKAVQARLAGLGDGPSFEVVRTMATGAVVVSLPPTVSADVVARMVARLASDPQVLSVEPSDVVQHTAGGVPPVNDPFLSGQWALRSAGGYVGGAAFRPAWTFTRGEGVVVAVLDSGILNHPDLAPNLLPGYDFVSTLPVAGDGDGRDNDPTDPGDFCLSTGRASSWHGVMVASQVAAVAGNAAGMAGAAPGAKVMPIRVLGRCGGRLDDVADALSWLAGSLTPGVPPHNRKVHVVNLSLAGSGPCYQFLQDAVTLAVNAGITVVAAAGNEGVNARRAPASCPGVISVGAHNVSGDLVNYSNYGPGLTLTAPAGGLCRNGVGITCDQTPTFALSVFGTRGFAGFGDVRNFVGTSAASPHVAAAAALLYAIKPDISPAEVRSALVGSAKGHAPNGFCATNKGMCGAGMLNAAGAVRRYSDAPVLKTTFDSEAKPASEHDGQ